MRKYFSKVKKVNGELDLPGDKSISHRAVLFSAMANGKSVVRNLPGSEDVITSINIIKNLGCKVIGSDNNLTIIGRGFRGFKKPDTNLNCGNSGTTARLFSGLLSAQKFSCTITGDKSLSNRPMDRIIEPLKQMGVKFNTNEGLKLPIQIEPPDQIIPINYRMPIPSAQVKSCILLAGLHNYDKTIVVEDIRSRDHTENLLGLVRNNIDGKWFIESSLDYYPQANEYFIPGDVSSAAFHIVLTLLTPNSELLIKNIGLNPTRTGFIEVLKKMGGNIHLTNNKVYNNEVCGDLVVKSSSLKNIKIDFNLIPNIIDEIPILTIAGIFADGDFIIENAKELRLKESDRINSISYNLKLLGLLVEEYEDGIAITGSIKSFKPVFESFDDHRIAMANSVLCMLLNGGGEVNGFEFINISNPAFENQIVKIITN